MKKRWLSLTVITLLGVSFITIPIQKVNASKYYSYSFWFNMNNWDGKPMKVVSTKPITIRKVAWYPNSINHYLSKSKVLKKGTHIKILADPQWNYYWAFFGKYGNWVYPHKKANWFVPLIDYQRSQRKKKQEQTAQTKLKKFDVALVNKKFYIKNVATLNIESVARRTNMIDIYSSFTNKSNMPVKASDIVNKYLQAELSYTKQAISFNSYPDNQIKPGKNIEIRLTGTQSEDNIYDTNIIISESSNLGLQIDNKVLSFKLK
ncbi:hypothetical protein OZX58_03000 [Lactobacillus sp. ESL0680]|uniref:hypothetical protein n=1 Tax=Lactobacillus sp. ESL0680 TaxID=2983210 RepID=UPI0023F92C5A|nr:hypothetical protein [Lactobacillus sp. ESL0680]WEV39221.1 hypothetical protein OZX58_03000 [Lactobacillus sp. ESL0680]